MNYIFPLTVMVIYVVRNEDLFLLGNIWLFLSTVHYPSMDIYALQVFLKYVLKIIYLKRKFLKMFIIV